MSIATVTAVRCQTCGQPLVPAVNAVIGELYNQPGGIAEIVPHLRDLVRNPLAGVGDEETFRQAIIRWTGATPEQIVEAVRHIEVEEWVE